jgi:hypothetical protein
MFPPLYHRVEAAVDQYDPMGLLACCAPADEYELEILDITLTLYRFGAWELIRVNNVERIATVVITVFWQMFYWNCIGWPLAVQIARKIIDPSVVVDPADRPTVRWFIEEPE